MRFLLAAAAPLAIALAAPSLAQDHSGHGAAHGAQAHAGHAALEAALANPNREADSARDQFRHPVETLMFFQVEPGMAVGEYAPGGGWYSRVLGNYLSADGKLVGLWRSANGASLDEKARTGLRDGAAAFPAKVEEWTGRSAAETAGYTLDAVPEAEHGTLDRVLLIRMLHNLISGGVAESELKRMHGLLKPGGMLGVVQHRAKAEAADDYADGSKGYLRQADVIALVEGQGFELVEASEINANAQDTADHPEGVWEMPPTLGTKREDLKSLGESDRMTLLFRKL
ncbi:class I SAM-dependent methyltransferase [Pelagerythrobacter sp.]|uniref:class I SAM-dependent methyltransferase n=1 Tax=Pelagerythrobacter sp. TaxID=2800702 RepID=UPI0035AED8FB